MPDVTDDLPRMIRQPGPPAAERILAVAGQGRALALDLPAGMPLLAAVARGFAAAGFAGGAVRVDGLALSPFGYVQPALSADGAHAAYYSAVFRPAGVARLERGALTLGRRDGAPFFHGHALWTEADGRRSGGHILPEEAVLAAPARVPAFGFAGGVFQADHDPETNFRLFGPVAEQGPAPAGAAPAFALRLRPNQDLCGALEGFCAARGIRHARLHGGVGSGIGARFADGRVVRNFATEAFGIWMRRTKPGSQG